MQYLPNSLTKPKPTPNQSEAEIANDVKLGVRDYWNQRAEVFDLGDSFVSRNESIQTAWRSVFSGILGFAPKDILDVGSGTGELALLFRSLGHNPRGIDLAPNMVALARKKVAERREKILFDEGDAESLPFDDESFDAVHARHLMWTLPQPEKALSEWMRVLRPGGIVLITESYRDGGGEDLWTRLREGFGRSVARVVRATGINKTPLMPAKPKASYPGKEHLRHHSGMGPEGLVAFLKKNGLVEVKLRDLVWLRNQQHAALPWHRRLSHRRQNVYYAAWGRKTSKENHEFTITEKIRNPSEPRP